MTDDPVLSIPPQQTVSDNSAVPAYSWVALAVLVIVAILNFMDRTLIGILQIPLKAELHLSDLQLGALVGTAFGLVYTLFGLPIGLMADRISRKVVLVAAIVVWTGLTTACGVVGGFVALLVCRMGVALGEAACAPVSHSMISDLFPYRRRATAVGFWSLGVPVGVILGFLFAGWLSATLGWRRSFISVGVFGLLIAALAAVVLREPKRGATEVHPVTARSPPLGSVIRLMWANKTYRYILLAAALHLTTLHSVTAWMPQFYYRTYHLPLRQVGMTMALILGVGGAIGTLVGGFMSDRLARRDARWRLWLSTGSTVLLVPTALLQYWTASLAISVLAGLLQGALLQVFFAPMIALTQSLMPARIRSFSGAVYVSFVNVFGMSLGPLLVGRLSDVLSAQHDIGAQSLRYALSAAEVGSLLSAPIFLMAAKTLRQDLALVDRPGG